MCFINDNPRSVSVSDSFMYTTNEWGVELKFMIIAYPRQDQFVSFGTKTNS